MSRKYKNGWKSTLPKCKICGKRLSTRKASLCKKCYGISMRGEGNPFYGKHHSEESKNKWRKSRAWWRKYKDGYKATYPNCEICGKKLTSRIYILCGKCYANNMHKKGLFLGKKHSIDTRKKMSEIAKRERREPPRYYGKDNHFWRGGISSLCSRIRHLSEYSIWRTKLFKRDNYTCQNCNTVGGRLEVHHEKSFILIIKEFLEHYNQFSLTEDKETLVRLAITYKPFWDTSNGKTLCKKCHYLTHPGRPKTKERIF